MEIQENPVEPRHWNQYNGECWKNSGCCLTRYEEEIAMKKTMVSLGAALAISVAALAGCGNGAEETTAAATEAAETEAAAEETTAAETEAAESAKAESAAEETTAAAEG